MPKTYCLLNHKLTENQINELKEKYNSEEIFYPDAELSSLWSQIKPTEKIDKFVIYKVLYWLEKACINDYLIIQGEYCVTFFIVDWALKNGLIPMCAVTKRVESERIEGEQVIKKHVFEHVCFRKYEYFCLKNKI